MADVRAQDSLLLINKQPQIGMGSTTFFVPKCKFPRPASGEVDLNTSFPLSRFVKGTKSFNVDFAVGGANSSSNVTFYINGTHHCIWNGTKIGYKGSEICGESNECDEFSARFAPKPSCLTIHHPMCTEK